MDKSKIEITLENIKSDKHLDYLIRAAENYLYQEDKKLIDDIKNEIKEKRRKNKKYEPSEQEKYILNYEKTNMFYRILIKPSVHLTAEFGVTVPFDKGAVIMYSSNRHHLARHIVIAHEIGHILLHMRRDKNFIRYLKIDDIGAEDEATYFAHKELQRISYQAADDDYLKNINVADIKIYEMIKGLRPEYTIP